jgi:hydroxymethylpyrimidine/phosphomethylpyrimidine kinase
MSPSSPLATESSSALTNSLPHTRPAVLVIAATDSSGGAGITRDVQVLSDFSVDALCAITAVTAQSNASVHAIHHVPADTIRTQIQAALATRPIAAIKIGMLGCRATVEAIVECIADLESVPIVLDPVLVASSGGVLLDAQGRAAMIEQLFPRVLLVTPNIPEAAALLDTSIATDERSMLLQAQRLLKFGPQAVLLKGGHSEGHMAVDLLVTADGNPQRLESRRENVTRRGTGCMLSTAIAARLASGATLVDACADAKRYVSRMLATPS